MNLQMYYYISFHSAYSWYKGEINTGHSPSPLELNCGIVVPVEVSTFATVHCFMVTRFWIADIQNCQKKLIFWAQIVLEKVA
jgi:hypothetical protein